MDSKDDLFDDTLQLENLLINRENNIKSSSNGCCYFQEAILSSVQKINFYNQLLGSGIREIENPSNDNLVNDIKNTLNLMFKGLTELEKYLEDCSRKSCNWSVQRSSENEVKDEKKLENPQDCEEKLGKDFEEVSVEKVYEDEYGVKIEPDFASEDFITSDLSSDSESEQSKILKAKTTNARGFICDICDHHFTTRKDLNSHRRKLHKPFKCDVCNKAFGIKSTLNAHTQIHSAVKLYKCDVCEKTFVSASNLYTHKFTHAERKFQCEICSRTFLRKGDLHKHMFTHNGEKPYKCDYCPLETAFKGTLIEHIRTHTGEKPFKCHICPKAFRVKTGLNSHLRRHAGIKPYKCNDCGKDFDSKSHLQTHRRIHTGEKPFSCKLCQKKFTRKANLREHMKIHNKDEVPG